MFLVKFYNKSYCRSGVRAVEVQMRADHIRTRALSQYSRHYKSLNIFKFNTYLT